jgi:hypothetical protein
VRFEVLTASVEISALLVVVPCNLIEKFADVSEVLALGQW